MLLNPVVVEDIAFAPVAVLKFTLLGIGCLIPNSSVGLSLVVVAQGRGTVRCILNARTVRDQWNPAGRGVVIAVVVLERTLPDGGVSRTDVLRDSVWPSTAVLPAPD